MFIAVAADPLQLRRSGMCQFALPIVGGHLHSAPTELLTLFHQLSSINIWSLTGLVVCVGTISLEKQVTTFLTGQ